MPSIAERWLPVIGWEGLYEVSDQGRVRSLDRVVQFGTQQRQVHGRIRKPGRTVSGVLYVPLSDRKRVVNRSVHQMVLEAFVGPCPDGMEGCHWNDDSEDNRLTNLRGDTHSANMFDRVRNGGHFQVLKTECPSGHEYTPENTKLDKKGRRYCRECHRIDARAKYWRDIENQRALQRDKQRRYRQAKREKAA